MERYINMEGMINEYAQERNL